MGLDMYLNKRTYIGNNPNDAEPRPIVKVKTYFGDQTIDLNKVKTCIEEVGYWCKANHIHKWFVDYVQDDNDDCKEYYVRYERLLKLKKTCELAIKQVESCPKTTKVEKDFHGKEFEYEVYDVSDIEDELLLPTTKGFFFGSTDYDSWYIQDCKDTIEIIDSLSPDEDYYYTSSW